MLQGPRIRCTAYKNLQSRRSSICRETDRGTSHYVEKRSHPSKIQDATIIHLFKRKGNPQVCENHRGISLLPIAGQILARLLLNRSNSQGFYQKANVDSGRTEEQLTSSSQQDSFKRIAKKQNVNLYMTFVDLTKASDTVIREGLWKIMANFSCPAHS